MAETLPEQTVEGSAAPPVPSGPPAVVRPEAGYVAVTKPGGEVVQVPEQNLGQAAKLGYRPSTEEEVWGEHHGWQGKAYAAGTGFARGASFGLSDKAIIEGDRALFGDESAEEGRRYLNYAKEAHPGYSLGGEIAGTLAGMYAIPGGAAAEGVEGAGLAARTLSRVAGAAPRLFAEGAAMGVGQQISEDALGDKEAVAENYLASGVKGGLLNVLIGGTLHAGGGAAKDALGRVVTGLGERTAGAIDAAAAGVEKGGQGVENALAKVSGKDIEALAAREFGYAPEGLGEKVRQQLVKISAGVSGKDSSILDRLTALDAGGKEARRIAVFDSEHELEHATQAFRKAGDDMLRADKLAMNEFKGELKAEKIASAVKTGNEAEVVAYAKSQIQKAIDIAESEIRHEGGVAPQAIKSLEGIARRAYHAGAELDALVAKGGEDINAKSFMLLDQVKREAQRWVSGGYNGLGRIADPFEARLAERSVRALDDFQNTLRGGLEDSDLFGKAGDIQKAINADWTMQIDASKRFHGALTTEVGRDPTNPFRQIRGIDPAKADTYARGLLNPNADLTHQAVKDYVESTERLAKTLSENVELPAATKAEVEKVISSAQAFRGATDKAEKTLTLVNQYKHLTEHAHDSFGTLAGMLGLHMGGPVGGLLGAALGTVANPGRAVAQMAALERMGSKLDEKIDAGIGAFFGAGKKAAKAVDETSEAAQTLSKKTTSEIVNALRSGVANPSALAERAGDHLGNMRDAAPNVARFATANIMRAAAYVNQQLPPPPPQMFTLGPPQKPPPMKESDLAKVRPMVEVLASPEHVLDALNQGRLSRDHVEALKVLYPKFYARIQDRVRMMQQNGEIKPLTEQQGVAMSVLFGVPVAPQMQPSCVLGFQDAFAEEKAPAPQGPKGLGGPSKLHEATALDKLEGGDE
jgi:hypothetical protein